MVSIMDADTSRNRTASQESFVPLLQLDPEPIDSPPILVDADSPVDLCLAESQDGSGQNGVDANSVVIKAPSAGAPGLSASAILGSTSTTATGPGPIFYLMRIQKFSSYAMGFFTSLHLANVSLIPAITRSVAGSENYLLMTREVYQTSLTEPILVALPVIAHVGSGIALRLLRRSQNLKKYGGAMPGTASPWPPLSYISMSGYAFTFFYAAHVFANRVLPLQVEGDSSNIGLAYVAHCFGRHPALSQVAYIGLLTVGCSHMIWGQAKWLGIAPSTKEVQRTRNVVVEKRKKYRRRSWAGLHGISAAFVALWAAGGLLVVARGGLTGGWVGKVYDDMFETIGL
ncbi:hypothetical protein EDB81DRAFT_205720 [Dactylonectria macrodidyma]|uniref:Mitochondrial adapter protein MCP1 transmembrane domain-containing protein n=1 Tax=Dactylonectria macrodidyma TaxID=307937 RepID=A0A9P9IP55_9HYPO|nr:hypothetical protein EDB81DRAFT_205720 [Dactylonectria macrodidyma]